MDWIAPPLRHAVRLQSRATQTTVAEYGTLRDALEDIGISLRRSWYIVCVRRVVLSALLMGLVLAIVFDLMGWLHWLVPTIAVVSVVVAVTRVGRRAPGTVAVARFLDHALALDEQLATALELETTPQSGLSARLRECATVTASHAATMWTVRRVTAGYEWAAMVVLLGALLATVAQPFSGAVALPHQGPSPSAVGVAPALPTPAASTRSAIVRIAVISAHDTSAPRPTQHTGAAQSRPGAPRGGATARSTTARSRATTSNGSANGTASRPGTASTTARPPSIAFNSGGRGLPTSRGAQGSLPSRAIRPAAKGSQTQQGAPGRTGASTGIATHSSSGASGLAAHTKRQGQSSNSRSGSPGAQQSSGKGRTAAPSSCVYCSHLPPSQTSAPGLITGKGQFVGQGHAGGQSAGHAQGRASAPGAATAPMPAKSRQLTITSDYAPTGTGQRSSKQVQGHDGPGTTQSAVVKAGSNGSQVFDYVPPDTNVVSPGAGAIVSRYFTPSPAS